VRASLRESGMAKEPGYSRIEVQKEVCFFFKGDKSHRKADEIYQVVDLKQNTETHGTLCCTRVVCAFFSCLGMMFF
ncbi:pentatricopeptide repeat-containing protein, partial [Trifolium medium]|nr:pentatricopeptide repeat-containing protein [Trifolium medium]